MRASILSFAPLALALSPASASAQCVDDVLNAPALPYGAQLGRTLDVEGGFAFAGAPTDSTLGPNSGSVAIFEHDATGFVWRQTLNAPGQQASDEFGRDLDADGEWLVVGTLDYANGVGEGAGVVYRRTPQGWTWYQTLRVDDPQTLYYAGKSVAIDGGRIVLGAPDLSTKTGAVFVFELAGGVWSQVARVDPATPLTVRGFGTAVDLDGDRLLVGATFCSAGGLAPGAGFVFDLEQGAWTQKGVLVGADTNWSDAYGYHVALDGDVAAISGWSHAVSDFVKGAVWVFELVGGEWRETQKVVSTPANPSRFGSSVDLRDGRLAVGARSETGLWISPSFAEVFHRAGATFVHEATAWGPPSGGGIGFGDAVVLWGDALLVGNSTGSSQADYVGDVELVDLPRVEVAGFCQATPNSTGAAAQIEVPCPGVLDGELLLRATQLPDNVGLFLAGSATANLPAQDGFLCVGGSLFRLAPGLAQGGVLDGALELGDGSAGGPLPPGSTWYLQAWYRDPAAGKSGGNFTPGLAVTRTH